jgi:glycosyltransferase involved in cell wall biosynthesis
MSIDNYLTNKRLFYILPKSNFFQEGERGRVTHALGIAKGFAENEFEVNLVSGPKIHEYTNRLTERVSIHELEKNASEKKWRKKLITTQKNQLSENDVFLIRYAISIPFFMTKMARLAKRKKALSIVEVNSLAIHNIKALPVFFRQVLLKFESFILSKYDLVYVVSETLKKQLKQANKKLNVIVVPNAANQHSKLPGKKGGKKRIVYMGTMQPYYDFNLLIEGFNRLLQDYPDITLEFYGKGSKFNDIASSVKINHQIKLHGRYDNENIPELLNRDSDILVLPYKNIPNSNIRSPIKLFEYMSLGLPMLGSNVGQLNEIIIDGHNGFLYKEGDSESLYRNLKYIYENYDFAAKVGSQAYDEFVKQHTWQYRVKEMIEKIRNASSK